MTTTPTEAAAHEAATREEATREAAASLAASRSPSVPPPWSPPPGSPARRAWSARSRRSAPRSSSGSPAARCCRCTTRCWTPRVRHVLVRHEQGAGHAATGYAQATGKVGVCMATSGPGATNLVTPIADAQMDSVPMVAITGQVPSHVIGTDGFQEADICGITMPITKHNFLVTEPAEIPQTIAAAFHLAATGRPGVVLVDIPKDVLQSETTFAWPPDAPARLPADHAAASGQITAAAKLIAAARRPVLYVGGGVLKAHATEVLAQLAELTGIPVVTTLMARGAFPDAHLSTSGCRECTAPSPRWPGCSGRTSSSRSAPGSTTGSPASCRRSRPARRSSTPTSTRPRSARTGSPTCRSSATPER